MQNIHHTKLVAVGDVIHTVNAVGTKSFNFLLVLMNNHKLLH